MTTFFALAVLTLTSSVVRADVVDQLATHLDTALRPTAEARARRAAVIERLRALPRTAETTLGDDESGWRSRAEMTADLIYVKLSEAQRLADEGRAPEDQDRLAAEVWLALGQLAADVRQMPGPSGGEVAYGYVDRLFLSTGFGALTALGLSIFDGIRQGMTTGYLPPLPLTNTNIAAGGVVAAGAAASYAVALGFPRGRAHLAKDQFARRKKYVAAAVKEALWTRLESRLRANGRMRDWLPSEEGVELKRVFFARMNFLGRGADGACERLLAPKTL